MEQETRAPADELRALVDLLPQFLGSAMRGWGGLTPLLEAAGVERTAFFLLRALVQERGEGGHMTRAEMHADLFNPYSTIRPILDALPALVTAGYVAQREGGYRVTREGRALFEHVEATKNGYLASLAPIAAGDLVCLTDTLGVIARSLRDAPEPERKAHQARAWRVMPPRDAAPMARLSGAVYALWMARDDCHNAAWHAAGCDGPAFDLLSRVWSGEAATVRELTEAAQEFQRPEDVARGVASLVAAGDLARDGETLRLTDRGRGTRAAIEAETDRLFFTPWPPLDTDTGQWLHATLGAVVARLLS